MRITAEQSAHIKKLDDIQAPVTMLNLRHKRLRSTELVGQLLLGHVCLLTRLYQLG
jgi:hypothetical protein